MKSSALTPKMPIVGVFMTKSEFFSGLADSEPTMPFYMYAEEAAEALERLTAAPLGGKPRGSNPPLEVDRAAAENAFSAKAKAEERAELTTRESIDVLAAYGIRTCGAGFAKSEDEAVAIANRIGYPSS